MKKRLHAGFTLAETLITVVLIGIIFLAVTGGFVAFQRAYTKITRKANAQVLLSTAVMEVTNDLKNATSYDTTNNAFFTTARGYSIQYTLIDTATGTLVKPVPSDSGMVSLPLVTKQTNTDNMYVDVSNLSYSATTHLFTVTIYIRAAENSAGYLEKQEIQVRPYAVF